jgi:tetratricopeptide (TPR) repeat protein
MSRTRRRVLVAVGVLTLAAVGVGAYWQFTRLSVAELVKKANIAADDRDFKAAAAYLDEYLAKRPDDLKVRLFAAQVARRQGDTAAVFKHMTAHRQKGGSEAEREFESRLMGVQEGNLPDAEKLLDEHPDNPLAVEAVIVGTLLKLRSRSGQMSRFPAGPTDPRVLLGIRAADKWVATRKGTADRLQGLVWWGRVRAAAGEHAAAVAAFRKVLEEDAAHPEARLHLAMTVLQSEPAGALEQLRGLDKVRPDDSEVLVALAATYRAFGRLDEARAVLANAVERKSDDLMLVLEQGLVELDANRPEAAEKRLRQVYARAAGDPSVNQALSRCMALMGNVAEAKKFQDRYDELEVLAKRPWRYPK